MMDSKLTCEQARSYDLVDYLATLGFNPVRINRNQYWYLSPFRIEETASFKINRLLNRWWDFGEGRGGNLIDFAIAYHRYTVGEFLQILEGKPLGNHFRQPQHREIPDPAVGKIVIIRRGTLNDRGLLHYLRQRRIPLSIAQSYCEQVWFELYGGTFKAIGFANDLGGFELRNAAFKGSSSPKYYTSIFCDQPGAMLCVFEGFFDFLSYLALIPPEDRMLGDYLVLNSLFFFERARLVMESYKRVNLFLDNDNSGRITSNYTLSRSGCYRDRSDLFKNYPDLNDYLVYFGLPFFHDH